MAVIAYKELNYGIIEYKDNGRYNLKYNAPGIGINLSNLTAESVIYYANEIEDEAARNINYFSAYQDYIRNGQCVAECKDTMFMVQDTCEKAIEACELYQGGYTGHIWTIDEIEQLKEPYYKMVEDSNSIRDFVNETYGSIPSPPSPTPPPECSEGDTKCIGYDLYKCIDGKWQLFERLSEQCGYTQPPPSAPYTLPSAVLLGAIVFLPPLLLYIYSKRK